ncbi:MAG: RsmB/NOP family class I SAM-dependent RNA methyltransferase [Bdellovibrionales bacterium]
MSPKFDKHYGKLWGDRWQALRAALKAHHQVAFRMESPRQSVKEMAIHQPGQMPERKAEGLLSEYFMDPASLLMARALPLEGVEKVLDMCAAPGGKSLVLISRLPDSAEIICNEPSGSRRESLTKVIQNYVPRDRREKVWVRGQDGAQYGLKMPAQFDAILVDAPCSGEAHLLENQKEMQNWSPKRSEGLAIKQYSLLSSAWSALKPGGSLVYSTCSISPLENDGVIEKLLKKKKDAVEILKPELEIEPEWTRHGFQYFPDQFGFGPLYGCCLRKRMA